MMYADYVKERFGHETIVSTHGFIVYSTKGQDCFIHELHIDKASRRSGHGHGMGDLVLAIAKERGCGKIWATVIPSSHTATEAMQTHLAWGMKIHSSSQDCIVTVREI